MLQTLQKKDFILLSYFSILQIILLIWILFIEKDNYLLFYFCYHVPLIIILLILFSKEYIPVIINIALLGQLLYVLDFLVSIIIQGPFLNYFEYYLENTLFSKILVLFAHFSSLILLIFYKEIKVETSHLFYSFLYFVLFYFPALYFVPAHYNINGVISTYTILDKLPLYSELYVIYIIFVIVLPTYFIQKIVERTIEKKKKL